MKITMEFELNETKCTQCGTIFAVESSVLERGEIVFCPRGHRQSSPTQPTEEPENHRKIACPVCHKPYVRLYTHLAKEHPDYQPEVPTE